MSSEAAATTKDRERAPAPLTSVVVVLASLAGGLGLLYGVLRNGPSGPNLVVDVVAGIVCCLFLLWRHRAPVLVAVLTAVGAALFATAGVANMVALFAVARRRRLVVALAIAVLDIAAGLVFAALYPGNSSWSVTVTVNVAISAAAVAWGALVRAQRSLVQSLEERAERAESEQRLRTEQIRGAERAEIAREMHDVVAHRVSLVALHAGGLAVRPDLSPEAVRDTALLIRRSAQDALDEMRRVVGALREDAPASGAAPTLADLERLVGESAEAGQPVDLTLDVPADAEVPPWLGRTAYRVVQESLTNALKHARGVPTTVEVRGRPGDTLTVSVRNALPLSAVTDPVTGGGAGLLGLTERVTLAGGSLRHGPREDHEFAVDAELPWPSSRAAASAGR